HPGHQHRAGRARIEVPADPGDRSARTPRLQPTRRAGQPRGARRPVPETPVTRRRSVLFAPGHQLRLLEKMARCGPDCVVLDLEDGTPPQHKNAARDVVAHALREVDFGGAERIVRVNAMDSPFIADDLAWLRGAGIAADAVLLPKVQGPEDLHAFGHALGDR